MRDSAKRSERRGIEDKACPFCHSTEIWTVDDITSGQWYRECMDCGALGPVGKDALESNEKWNHRKASNRRRRKK